ncbi:MAG: hypothetical protein R3C17_11180 [Planctomycetaceae bacterium]
MNNESATNSSQSRMPSDARMESLLQDFFRLEVPKKLDQPFRRSDFPAAAVVTAVHVEENRAEPLKDRSVRVIAVAMSVSAMALALLVVMTATHPGTTHPRNATYENRDGISYPNDADRPMLVSPLGDSHSSSTAITPDGVTLEEADNIELHE